MSNTAYDSRFLSIPFYRSHPYIMPFVGDDYESSKHKKLLLIGESHYMPEGSAVHHDVNSWYGNPVLTSDEQDWSTHVGLVKAKAGVLEKRLTVA